MGSEQDDWLGGLGVNINEVLQIKTDFESSVQAELQSMQNSAFEAAGISPETAQLIRDGEQAIADFDRGRQQGRAEGSMALVNMLPPVQFVKAAARIATAEDAEAEALKIAEEKANTAANIGRIVTDPVGFGSDLGTKLGNEAVAARREGRSAEFVGKIVGHGDVIAATVAAGGGLAGAGEGAALVAGEEAAALAASEEAAALAAGEEAAASGEAALAGEEGVTIVPRTPPPPRPLPLRPTEFPKGPEFNPTQQPGPPPDLAPGEVNPFDNPFIKPTAPRIPRPPRLPTFDPDILPDLPPPDTIPEIRVPEIEPVLPPDTLPELPLPDLDPLVEPLELPPDTIPEPLRPEFDP
jgi:hypothetical protein